jgi:hypothetical protein
MAEFARMEARTSADPTPYPSRLMRILLAVREVVLILWLAVGITIGVLLLTSLAEFGKALGDVTEPAPVITECVGEVC